MVIDQGSEFLTVHEVALYLRIGRTKAYELCREPGFPALRVGRTIRVSRDGLRGWVRKQEQQGWPGR